MKRIITVISLVLALGTGQALAQDDGFTVAVGKSFDSNDEVAATLGVDVDRYTAFLSHGFGGDDALDDPWQVGVYRPFYGKQLWNVSLRASWMDFQWMPESPMAMDTDMMYMADPMNTEAVALGVGVDVGSSRGFSFTADFPLLALGDADKGKYWDSSYGSRYGVYRASIFYTFGN